MNVFLISGVLLFIALFLLLRMPKFLVRFVGTSLVRIVIGTLLLLFLNVIGNQFGFFIPINLLTVLISSVLGVFGIGSLVAIQLFVF